MMDAIGQYIYRVCGAALISAVIRHLTKESGVCQMIAGLFLALTVLAPFADLRLGDFEKLLPDIDNGAQIAVENGKADYEKELVRCISDRVEAYILDKGQDLGLSLTVEIELSDDAMPKPVGVRLRGEASPYAKRRMQQILADELGIAKENQLWM